MAGILKKLEEGDMRSIGKSDEVVREVLGNPPLFGELFEGLHSDNPGVRMRSADALEKISAVKPELLRPYKHLLLDEATKTQQQEVQWHLAQMLSYLALDKEEEKRAVDILLAYVDRSNSNIVKTFSLQTLTEIAQSNSEYKPMILKKVKDTMKGGSPAVISRGRNLLKILSENR